MITIKTPQEIKIMREGGKVLAKILKRLKREIKAGVKISYVNTLAEELIKKNNARASFKNYQRFPAALCASINSDVVHGVPKDRKILEGDVVGLDLGLKYKDLYTDAAITVIAGKATKEIRNFVKVCRQALDKGIREVRVGNHIGDISWAIQNFVERKGYSVVRDLVGHGVGYKVHEEPRIPNFGKKGQGPILKHGMTFCIEPMINMGQPEVELSEDGHAFRTRDKSLSAHFEHTVAVVEKGCLILTE